MHSVRRAPAPESPFGTTQVDISESQGETLALPAAADSSAHVGTPMPGKAATPMLHHLSYKWPPTKPPQLRQDQIFPYIGQNRSLEYVVTALHISIPTYTHVVMVR